MWGRLRRELELELAEMRDLLAVRAEIDTDGPDGSMRPVDTFATGALLHSFYNGVENLLKRIEVATAGTVPRGEHWHTELLALAGTETPSRPAVVSAVLMPQLRRYLEFRHAFQHVYAHRLVGARMLYLLRDLPEVARALETEIRDFLARLEAWSPPE